MLRLGFATSRAPLPTLRRFFGVFEFLFALPVAALLDEGMGALEFRSSRREEAQTSISQRPCATASGALGDFRGDSIQARRALLVDSARPSGMLWHRTNESYGTDTRHNDPASARK